MKNVNIKMKSKKLDLIVLFTLPILSFILVWGVNPGYLVAAVLFYLLPSVWLILRLKNFPVVKIITRAIILSIPFFFVVDYIGTISGLWVVPQSSISFHLLGIIPIEDYIWFISATLYIICVYHLVNNILIDENYIFNRKTLVFILFSAVSIIALLLLINIHQEILVWKGKFAYLFMGMTFFLVPGVLLSFKWPGVFIKELKVSLPFLLSTFLFEIIATHYNYWRFIGEYIFKPFSINAMGYVPIEEIFFVGIAGPIAAISFYNLLNDKSIKNS